MAHAVPVNGPINAASEQALPYDTLLIGQGFNTITGQPGGMSVKFDDENDLTTAANSIGQVTNYYYEQLTDLVQISDRLGLSASASFGFGIFGGDLAVQFMQSDTFNSFENFIFIDVLVTNPSMVLKSYNLTVPALEKANRGMMPFIKYCGNSFIYGTQTGGRLTAVVQFSARSTDEQQIVHTKVGTSVAGFAAGNLTIDQAIQQLEGISDISVHILRKGGVDVIPSLSDLGDAARHLPTLVALKQ